MTVLYRGSDRMSSGKDSYLVNFYHGEGEILRRLSRDTDIPVAVLLRSAVRCFLISLIRRA